MINAVLVDDNTYFLKEIEKQVKNFAMQHGYLCKTYLFTEYNDDFYNLVCHPLENMIGLFDIEIEKDMENGIDAARKIRQYNQDIEIIFLTIHDTDEYKNKIVTSNIKSMGFIYKGNLKTDFDLKMNEFLMNIEQKDMIVFSDGNNSYSLSVRDICQVTTIKGEKKSVIKTISGEYPLSLPLKEVEAMLFSKSKRFIKIHRSYTINILQVAQLNVAKKIIIFHNGDKIESISRPYKDNLIQLWEEYHPLKTMESSKLK